VAPFSAPALAPNSIPAANRTLQTDADGTITTSTYDNANRALVATAAVTGSPAVVTTYTSDAAGNRTEVQTPWGNTYTQWDAAGNLSIAEPPVGVVTLGYDAERRRSGKATPDGTYTRFVYDAMRLLQETEADGTEEITYTSATDDPYGELLSEYDPASGDLYHQFDAQASTDMLSDDSGDALGPYRYRAFGLMADASMSGWADLTPDLWASMGANDWGEMPVGPASHLAWVGQKGYYLDPETQLYLLGGGGGSARYYDPVPGRFVSQDRTGMAGGDANFYRYCGNDPVNKKDPSGADAQGPPNSGVNLVPYLLAGKVVPLGKIYEDALKQAKANLLINNPDYWDVVKHETTAELADWDWTLEQERAERSVIAESHHRGFLTPNMHSEFVDDVQAEFAGKQNYYRDQGFFIARTDQELAEAERVRQALIAQGKNVPAIPQQPAISIDVVERHALHAASFNLSRQGNEYTQLPGQLDDSLAQLAAIHPGVRAAYQAAMPSESEWYRNKGYRVDTSNLQDAPVEKVEGALQRAAAERQRLSAPPPKATPPKYQGIPDNLEPPKDVPEFIFAVYTDEEYAKDPINLVDAISRQREFGGKLYEAVSIQHSESRSAWLLGQLLSGINAVFTAGSDKWLWGQEIFSSHQKTTDVIYHLSYRNFPGISSTDAENYDAIFQNQYAEQRFLETVGQVQQQYKNFHLQGFTNIAIAGAVMIVASVALQAVSSRRRATMYKRELPAIQNWENEGGQLAPTVSFHFRSWKTS
jgi:RHS repeat-associated protein